MGELYCSTCGRLRLLHHQCPPLWEVWDAEDGDSSHPVTVRAHDAQAAAEHFAGEWDDEGTLANGVEIEVCVRAEDGALTRWSVSGEAVVEYHATEVERG